MLNIPSFSSKHLNVLAEPPLSPFEVKESIVDKSLVRWPSKQSLPQNTPLDDESASQKWHAHLSLLAAPWGDGRTLSPVSPLVQTIWVTPPVINSMVQWKKRLIPLLDQKNTLQPSVILNLQMDKKESLKDLVIATDKTIWPMSSTALARTEDQKLCRFFPIMLISESATLASPDQVPDCASDFTSFPFHTTGLGADGKTSVFLDDPTVLPIVLAGALAHLIALKPGLPLRLYAHALRSTSKDYGTPNWSFGTPQLSAAVEYLLLKKPEVTFLLKPRMSREAVLLLASTSENVSDVRIIEPRELASQSECKTSYLGSIRCIIKNAESKLKKYPQITATVTLAMEKQPIQRKISWDVSP